MPTTSRRRTSVSWWTVARWAIQSFDQNTEAPTSLVLLQDLSGSMSTNRRESKAQPGDSSAFSSRHALPGDEFAIATFASGRGQVEVPFTTDVGALQDSISRWEGYGTTALNDAVAWIPEISAEGHNSRRFAILVTDGVDNASTLAPAEAREVVRAAQVPVYVLGLDSGSPYEISNDGKKVYRYADVLNLLAGVTGGRYYPISRSADLATALAAIAQDLRHQYVLGFSTSEGERAYRHLTVEVKAGQGPWGTAPPLSFGAATWDRHPSAVKPEEAPASSGSFILDPSGGIRQRREEQIVDLC